MSEFSRQQIERLNAAYSGSGYSRRDLLKRAAAMAAVPTVLGACGAGGTSNAAGTAKSYLATAMATPSHGGVLRYAAVGNGTNETYNPALINTFIDLCHGYSVFDSLTRPAFNFGRERGLALEWIPNNDASVWDVTLRKGVVWHDGKPFTADDVIYTLRLMGSPAHIGHPSVVDVQLRDLKKLDPHTLRIPLVRPNSRLPDFFFYVNSALVVQDGTKSYQKPVGTGPFKLEQFTVGQSSRLTRNVDYWDHPKPYVDELQIISIDDDTARLNALVGGQIDIAANIAPEISAINQFSNPSAARLIVGLSGATQPFYINMRCDKAPFNDNRVRTAMKLIIDREQINQVVYRGFGNVLNDMWGQDGIPLYDTSVPQRTPDIEKARSLLKAAGHPDLRLTLQTTSLFNLNPPSELIAQQAAAAGVTVNLLREPGGPYFDPTQLWTKMTFCEGGFTVMTLPQAYSNLDVTGASADEDHFDNPTLDKLYYQGVATTNASLQKEIWNELQTYYRDNGGRAIYGGAKSLDFVSPKVRGFGPATYYSTDDYRVWNWGLA